MQAAMQSSAIKSIISKNDYNYDNMYVYFYLFENSDTQIRLLFQVLFFQNQSIASFHLSSLVTLMSCDIFHYNAALYRIDMLEPL